MYFIHHTIDDYIGKIVYFYSVSAILLSHDNFFDHFRSEAFVHAFPDFFAA